MPTRLHLSLVDGGNGGWAAAMKQYNLFYGETALQPRNPQVLEWKFLNRSQSSQVERSARAMIEMLWDEQPSTGRGKNLTSGKAGSSFLEKLRRSTQLIIQNYGNPGSVSHWTK